MTSDEVVALYDPHDPVGGPAGTAPRSRVRCENLPHAARSVVIERAGGDVLVHRRSPTKDLWPGLLDCACGGVLLAGEAPEAGARRELAEEVGIDDPRLPLEPLLRDWYHDDDTWHLAFVYRVVWDGPVRFVDGEVADAWWERRDAVAAALADPSSPFVPGHAGAADRRALLTRDGDLCRESGGIPGPMTPITRQRSPEAGYRY